MFDYEERKQELYEKKKKYRKRQGGCKFEGYVPVYIKAGVSLEGAEKLAKVRVEQDEADAMFRAVKQAIAEEMGWKRGRPKPQELYQDSRYLEAQANKSLKWWEVYKLEYEYGYLGGGKTKEEREEAIAFAEKKIKEFGEKYA